MMTILVIDLILICQRVRARVVREVERALSVLLGKKMKKKQVSRRMESLKMKKRRKDFIMKRTLVPLSSKGRMTYQKVAGSRSCNPSMACGQPRI